MMAKNLPEAITNKHDGGGKASARIEPRQSIHQQREWRQSIRRTMTYATRML